LLGETAASGQKAARDIDLVRAVAAEQRLAHRRDIRVVEEEIGKVKEAMVGIRRSLGQQEGEVSGLKEVLGNLESKHAQLQRMVARQGDDLAETARRNEELGGRVQQLEEENRRLHDSSERLKGKLARVEAGQQSDVARLQEEIAAGGSNVKEDLGTIQRDVAKLKEDMIVTRRMTGKDFFAPLVKKGKLRMRSGNRTDEIRDIPDGIIAHLTRECGGNVHDRHVVDVTCGSFEKETVGANQHSGSLDNRADRAAKNAADLETDSLFGSAYRRKVEDIPHTRNNWICYDFKKRRIMPTHYTIRTKENGSFGHHLKSSLVETSADGESWREVARKEDKEHLNRKWFICIFAVAGGGECRFIRLVKIGRNHAGNGQLLISAWEVFGSLVK
jgi:hypothetical protein